MKKILTEIPDDRKIDFFTEQFILSAKMCMNLNVLIDLQIMALAGDDEEKKKKLLDYATERSHYWWQKQIEGTMTRGKED